MVDVYKNVSMSMFDCFLQEHNCQHNLVHTNFSDNTIDYLFSKILVEEGTKHTKLTLLAGNSKHLLCHFFFLNLFLFFLNPLLYYFNVTKYSTKLTA